MKTKKTLVGFIAALAMAASWGTANAANDTNMINVGKTVLKQTVMASAPATSCQGTAIATAGGGLIGVASTKGDSPVLMATASPNSLAQADLLDYSPTKRNMSASRILQPDLRVASAFTSPPSVAGLAFINNATTNERSNFTSVNPERLAASSPDRGDGNSDGFYISN